MSNISPLLATGFSLPALAPLVAQIAPQPMPWHPPVAHTNGAASHISAPARGAAKQSRQIYTPQAPALPQPSAAQAPGLPLVHLTIPNLSEKQRYQIIGWLQQAREQGIEEEADARFNYSALDNDNLVTTALERAKLVHSGRLEREDFLPEWSLRPKAFDVQTGFNEAVQNDTLQSWMEGLPPQYAGYDALVKGLAKYRDIQNNGGWQRLNGALLGPGSTGVPVLALRKRLALEDPQVETRKAQYDENLFEAVKRAQGRYGIDKTGKVTPSLIAALNVPLAVRVNQILANIERWRWMPSELPKKRVQVNIAAAVLALYDENDHPDGALYTMRTVTGKPGHETPMLTSTISQIVVNPPWNVPDDIAEAELWHKGSAYLAAHGFKIIRDGNGKARLQQAAGTQSALGRLKFNFSNSFSVYLHDTPSHSTFGTNARLASHGCVRLEKPRELAALILRNNSAWTGSAISEAIASGETSPINLAPQERVSVFLLYWNAWASESGAVSFRSDPYGWDALLSTKMRERAASDQAAARARRLL
jgi:L,D-transpeptidase YcbB